MVFLRCKVVTTKPCALSQDLLVSRGCRLQNPLPITSKSAWSLSHYDPGEIRTESAIRPSPPEKKERLENSRNQKAPRKNPRRRICIYLLFGFFINSNPDLTKEIFKHEFAIAN